MVDPFFSVMNREGDEVKDANWAIVVINSSRARLGRPDGPGRKSAPRGGGSRIARGFAPGRAHAEYTVRRRVLGSGSRNAHRGTRGAARGHTMHTAQGLYILHCTYCTDVYSMCGHPAREQRASRAFHAACVRYVCTSNLSRLRVVCVHSTLYTVVVRI